VEEMLSVGSCQIENGEAEKSVRPCYQFSIKRGENQNICFDFVCVSRGIIGKVTNRGNRMDCPYQYN
jgi:hypothetical protein